jgi:regulator of sigma D
MAGGNNNYKYHIFLKRFKMTDRLVQYHSEKYNSEINSDISMLSEQDKKILDYSLNKEWVNPKFKLRWFVGETQITPFAKLRQWLLEIKSREESIENLEYEIAKWQVQIDKHNHIANTSDDEFVRRESKIEEWNLNRNQIMTKRRLSNWYLERQQLIDLVNEFLSSEEALLPDGSGRTYMDILNTEEEDIYEAEYWSNRLAKQAATDLLFYGRVGTGNMDAILSMHPQQQTKTLSLALSYATQIKNIQDNIQIEIDKSLNLENKISESALSLPKKPEIEDQKISVLNNEDLLDVYNT